MTGRHRGQSEEQESAGERAPRQRRIAVMAGAFLVPVALATVVAFSLRDQPGADRPDGAVTPTPKAVRATPSAEPTFGQYVPPESEPQAETKAPRRVATPPPAPKKKATPKPTPSREARPGCPWTDLPFLDRWCHRHRHMGR